MHTQQKVEEEIVAPGPNEQGQGAPETVNTADQHTPEAVTTALVAATPEPDFIEGEVVEDLSEDGPDFIAKHPSSPRIRSFLPIVLTTLTCFVFVMMSSLLPILNPTATITIIPTENEIVTTATLLVGQGTHDIPGRLLPPLTLAQTITALATGHRHQQAQVAHGTVTLYNGLLTAQTITAGMLLTGTDGIRVITEQQVTIPAATPPIEGQVTVPAHALHSGSQGNIAAYDINTPCCLTAVKAVNTVAFQGGRDEREYTVITQGDINTAATALKTTLAQSTRAALVAQLAPGEGLITPTCIVHVIPDHRPGDEATHIKISVSESCPAIAYDSVALEEQATYILTNEAAPRLGVYYLLVGAIQVSVIHAIISNYSDHLPARLLSACGASQGYTKKRATAGSNEIQTVQINQTSYKDMPDHQTSGLQR